MECLIINQIKRVDMLSEMAKEKLIDYKNDTLDYAKWKNENPNTKYYGYRNNRTNPTEVKRLMLVLRQEMIALEKLI